MMMVTVNTNAHIIAAKAISTIQMTISSSLFFSSCNSTSSSSPRFCNAESAVKPNLRNRFINPGGWISAVSAIKSFAVDEDRGDQPDTEGNGERLIRVFADDAVGCLRAGDGAFLEFAAGLAGAVERGGKARARSVSAIVQFIRS